MKVWIKEIQNKEEISFTIFLYHCIKKYVNSEKKFLRPCWKQSETSLWQLSDVKSLKLQLCRHNFIIIILGQDRIIIMTVKSTGLAHLLNLSRPAQRANPWATASASQLNDTDGAALTRHCWVEESIDEVNSEGGNFPWWK